MGALGGGAAADDRVELEANDLADSIDGRIASTDGLPPVPSPSERLRDARLPTSKLPLVSDDSVSSLHCLPLVKRSTDARRVAPAFSPMATTSASCSCSPSVPPTSTPSPRSNSSEVSPSTAVTAPRRPMAPLEVLNDPSLELRGGSTGADDVSFVADPAPSEVSDPFLLATPPPDEPNTGLRFPKNPPG